MPKVIVLGGKNFGKWLGHESRILRNGISALIKDLSGLPWCLRWQRIYLQCKRPGFGPWVVKIPWRREWLPMPVFLPGEFHGQRSLVGYSPWGCKESDMTEQPTLKNLSEFPCPFCHVRLQQEDGYLWTRNQILTRHWTMGISRLQNCKK